MISIVRVKLLLDHHGLQRNRKSHLIWGKAGRFIAQNTTTKQGGNAAWKGNGVKTQHVGRRTRAYTNPYVTNVLKNMAFVATGFHPHPHARGCLPWSTVVFKPTRWLIAFIHRLYSPKNSHRQQSGIKQMDGCRGIPRRIHEIKQSHIDIPPKKRSTVMQKKDAAPLKIHLPKILKGHRYPLSTPSPFQ